MRWVIGCETSGRVRDEMLALGHDAISVDLLPSDRPGPHHQGELLAFLAGERAAGRRVDGLIGFPDCTFVAGSGIHWNRRIPGRAQKTLAAVEFFATLLALDIPRIALENPIGVLSTKVRKPDQIVQPYMFGDDASKRTCFWTKNLPLLVVPHEELWIAPRWGCGCGVIYDLHLGKTGCPECGGSHKVRKVWGNQTASGQNKLGPSADRWKIRSETYPGIARAITQWCNA